MKQQQGEMPLRQVPSDIAFVRLSWVCVNSNGQALFLKSPKREVLFEPGLKRVTGLTDEAALAEKIWRDLRVKFIPDSVEFLFSFRAQAFGPDRSTMMENRCFGARIEGPMQPTKYVTSVHWLGTAGKGRTTLAGAAYIDRLFAHGLVG